MNRSFELATVWGREIGGRYGPQQIASLFAKTSPELARRFPGVRYFAPVFDDEGRAIGFKPAPSQTGGETRSSSRATASVSALRRQLAASMATIRRQDADAFAQRLARLRQRYPVAGR